MSNHSLVCRNTSCWLVLLPSMFSVNHPPIQISSIHFLFILFLKISLEVWRKTVTGWPPVVMERLDGESPTQDALQRVNPRWGFLSQRGLKKTCSYALNSSLCFGRSFALSAESRSTQRNWWTTRKLTWTTLTFRGWSPPKGDHSNHKRKIKPPSGGEGEEVLWS